MIAKLHKHVGQYPSSHGMQRSGSCRSELLLERDNAWDSRAMQEEGTELTVGSMSTPTGFTGMAQGDIDRPVALNCAAAALLCIRWVPLE